MRLIAALTASALLLIATGPAVAGPPREEARLAKLLKDRVAGAPVDCIYLPLVRSSQIYSGTAIVYDAGRTIYVNRPESGARYMYNSDVMVTEPLYPHLCKVDIVRLRDNGTFFDHGFVGLGDFVPYTKAP